MLIAEIPYKSLTSLNNIIQCKPFIIIYLIIIINFIFLKIYKKKKYLNELSILHNQDNKKCLFFTNFYAFNDKILFLRVHYILQIFYRFGLFS